MTTLYSLDTDDCFLHLAPRQDQKSDIKLGNEQPLCLLFFIPGNPGLISYYRPFFTSLLHQHTSNSKTSRLAIAALSLGNFETSQTPQSELEQTLLYPARGLVKYRSDEPYTLKEQVLLTFGRLLYIIELLEQSRNVGSVEIYLAGHSVGAYIALEIVRLWYEKTSISRGKQDIEIHSTAIRATFLLTPTIFDIAHSPSGRIAAPVLANLPFFPALGQFMASACLAWLSEAVLSGLVGRITGMQGQARETTCRFLRAKLAVKQALSMAADEMREIGLNQWQEEVWGVVVTESSDLPANSSLRQWTAPKHYFLFAKQDDWIATSTRDEVLVVAANRSGGGDRVVVDESGELGLFHAWCTRQAGSDAVARIVSRWLQDPTTPG